jgi:hypothetical protein
VPNHLLFKNVYLEKIHPVVQSIMMLQTNLTALAFLLLLLLLLLFLLLLPPLLMMMVF